MSSAAPLPLMERYGMAGTAEPPIDMLEERVREEFAAGGGIFVGPSLIAAWAP